jgi:hypothetical protein
VKRKSNLSLLLYRYRYHIGLILFSAAVVNLWFGFSGVIESRFGVFLGQIWTGQAVYQYVRGGRVTIGAGGLDKDADPLGRAILASFSFFLYLLFFVPVDIFYS